MNEMLTGKRQKFCIDLPESPESSLTCKNAIVDVILRMYELQSMQQEEIEKCNSVAVAGLNPFRSIPTRPQTIFRTNLSLKDKTAVEIQDEMKTFSEYLESKATGISCKSCGSRLTVDSYGDDQLEITKSEVWGSKDNKNEFKFIECRACRYTWKEENY